MIAMFIRDWLRLRRWIAPVAVLFLALLTRQAWLGGEWLNPVSHEFWGVTLLGFPAFAVLLGFAQFHPERRGGQREVLLHRPVDPGRLFAGRALAGLAVYLLCTLGPLCLSLVWCVLSEQRSAPFEWAMVLPAFADVEAGLLFYFAGVMVALREARWLASRLLPFACAAACSYAVFVLPSVTLTAVCLLLALPAFVWAARASFLQGLGERGRDPLSRLASGLVISGGLVLVGGLLFFFCSAPFRTSANEGNVISKEGEILRFEAQGRWYVLTALGDAFTAREEPLGRVRQNRLFERRAPSQSLTRGNRLSERGLPRWARRYYASLTSAPGEGHWYFVHSLGLLEHYGEHGGLLGRLGQDGYRSADESLPKAFEGRLLNAGTDGATLVTERGVLRFTAEPPGVETLYRGSIEGASASYSRGGLSRLTMRSDGRLRQLDADGVELLDTSFARPLDELSQVSVYQLGDAGSAVVYLGDYGSEGTVDLVTWLDAAGQEIGRREVAARRSSGAPSETGRFLAGLLTPPLLRVGWPVTGRLLNLSLSSWFIALEPGRLQFVGAGLAALVCALAALAIGLKRGLKAGQAAGWGAVAALLGPIGLLLMLIEQDFPLQIACPSCGEPRSVQGESCGSCEAPWPEPAADPTRIVA